MSLDITLYIGDKRVFEANFTHNVSRMADQADLYDPIWHADQNCVYASDLIDPLIMGIADMKQWPEHYRQFDAPNKWGTYDQFLPWLERLLEACTDYPDAKIFIDK